MMKYIVRELTPEGVSRSLSTFHPFVRDLLYARGIADMESAEAFLNPDYDDHTHDPFLLKGVDKAVERIIAAVKNKEKIAIWSDYDADGIPGAVVLHDFFKKSGYDNFVNYIPLRNEEGFGLNEDGLRELASQGVTLVVTIDCGIADVAEAKKARELGMDLIITDHHVPGSVLPSACAIVNPKQAGCRYPEKMLCGSGVIFKVVQALISTNAFSMESGQEKWMLDMVGLATLSDMVPLLGENRVFARYGLLVLRKSPRVGLGALLSHLNIDQRTVSEDDVAFMVTPRINAASRMGIPRDAFTLLSTNDQTEAGALAEHLDRKNDERKGLVASMVREIKKILHGRDSDMRKVIVIGNPEWKPSLLGLVAGSFSDEHNRPVFLWGREGTNGNSVIKGSCRSGNGVSVLHLMEDARDVFLEFGGHKGAGGFSVSMDNIHSLEDRLNESYEKIAGDMAEIQTVIDKRLSLDAVTWETYSHIEKFAPFGFENPKPIFLFEQAEIAEVALFGKEKNHLRLALRSPSGKKVSAIAFFTSPDKFSVPISPGLFVNLVATMEKSTFRNFPELRLRIVDVF